MWQSAKNQYHLLVAILSNLVFRFPARKLTVIGVTGTDGKTTTVNLIYHFLKTAGKHVSMISTVGARINGEESALGFHVTTPSSFQIQRFFRHALLGTKETQYVVLEVSSHSIDQNRIWGIPFRIGVITNITNEHLDYHKTYDNYLKTKAKLLQKAKTTIVNVDDTSYSKLLPLLKNKDTLTYGIINAADITPKQFANTSELLGTFNAYNILAAAAVCKALGVEEAVIKMGIKSFKTPLGRMNAIFNNKKLTVMVDYAHTPNGLKQALTALTEIRKDRAKIIALVGAEGKRDPGKREEIGRIAAGLADITIITAVDPRGELDTINAAILTGAQEAGGIVHKSVFVEPDRKKAIALAIKQLAKPGDIVGIFGKGHESSMNLDGKHEIPWDDTEEVKKTLV